MAENFCFALLRTTTLQILQSAGFESVHVDPTNILTDVFCQYLQLLASTASTYAQLSGRTTGNIRDVIHGLSELAVDPESLLEWLEEEGKVLTPTWTAESDPGRILEGIVKSGRTQHEDVLVYEYKDIPEDALSDDEIYFFDGDEEEGEDCNDSNDDPGRSISPIPDAVLRETNALPEYVPSYFPPFPSTAKEEAETDTQPLLSSSLPLSVSQPSSNSTMLPPVIVKTRKKPIDNPFMHITPFEESSLAAEKDTSLALSVALQPKENDIRKKQTTTNKRRKVLTSLPMKEFLDSLKRKEQGPRKPKEELSGNANIFRNFTQEEAAPGNNMFGQTTGILGEMVRHIAQPVAVAKLSSPNLLVDVATTATTSTPSNPVSAVSTPTATNGFPNIQEPSQPKPNGTSMLATLAGGQTPRKQSIGAVSGPSTTTSQAATPLYLTSITPSTSKSTASTPAASKPTLAPISLASLSATSSSKAVKKKKVPKLTLNLTNGDTTTQTGPSSTASTPSSATTPLSTPKIRFKIRAPEPSESPAKTEPAPPPPPTTSIQGNETEVIRCVCENPTIDYGTFMIACDTCSVWFHGSCVGIAESDQVEEWHCQRCRA
ncbi:transcription initiation factor TFIID subunit 3 [Apophysomyces ossiformis]|uniref:Transcription initiation factor TFIID subunit 3 n=1 Tax=Apophysomyces ossiformis TaxID=679940 RepID=A0A8H7BFF6_9FUNG|nr:transcription initiation factor TFIID subunit 3 [Apophysomyces ossiformis]